MTVHEMHLEISKEINASPEAVYSLVSDLSRMGEWSTENIGGEWTTGDPGQVGSRFLGTNRIKGFEFVAAPDDGPFVRWTYQIEGLESGCSLTEIWDVMSLPPSLAKLDAEGLAGRKDAVKAAIEATLNGIKASAEQ